MAARASVESLVARDLRGEVVVALPSDMLLLTVFPRLGPFLAAHPGISLVFDHAIALADLTRREADIAVRVWMPEAGEELTAVRLRDVHFRAFCRPEFLSAMEDPSDPRCHRWVGWARGTKEDAWLAPIAGDRVVLRCHSPVTLRHAVQAGLGTGVLPRVFGRVTPGIVEAPIAVERTLPLVLITHRAIRRSPPVAAVWDELVRLLRASDGDDEELGGSLSVYGW